MSVYRYITTDPTYERMEDYIRVAERYTWPKISMVDATYRIERVIENAVRSHSRRDSLLSQMTMEQLRARAQEADSRQAGKQAAA